LEISVALADRCITLLFTIPREQDHHRTFEALNTCGYYNMYHPLYYL